MILIRTYQKKQTIGSLCFEGYELFTMELPWKENERRKSCIPEGEYTAVPRWSKKYGNHFHVLDVENRSYILFHTMNYYFQGMGCIGVGMSHRDINGDGLLDTTSSKKAMQILLEKFPQGFQFQIVNKKDYVDQEKEQG